MPIIKRKAKSKAGPSPKRKPSGSTDEVAMYNSVKWRKLRAYVIQREPLCRECKRQGRTTLARVVDHIEQARKHPELFYNLSNLQPLCDRCHNRKSARERHKLDE